MDPVLASRLGQDLADALRPVVGDELPSAVVAPALGGVIVSHEVGRGFGCRAVFTERQEGEMLLRRGFGLEPGEPVVVVEDVITTGRSTREVLDAVGKTGARVLAVGSIVDRSSPPPDFGVPYRSLLQVEVATWPAAECPRCAEGSLPVKPGSRTG